ncbi:MAG TPA: hypothetical protein VG722_01550, partial [Tepidisphaeraceae bacterium]|nr:hypothetical protein [Tepidisphaeraceae bacterium]
MVGKCRKTIRRVHIGEPLERRLLLASYPYNVVRGTGPLLSSMEVDAIYCGSIDPAEKQTLDDYMNWIVKSDYWSQLGEYSIGPGSFHGGEPDAPGDVTYDGHDSTAQQVITYNINFGSTDMPDAQRLYVLFVPDAVTDPSGAAAYHWYYAYHGQTAYYAVVPEPTVSGSLGQTEIDLSHEMIEAATDPDGATGWRGDTATGKINGNDEIADFADGPDFPDITGGSEIFFTFNEVGGFPVYAPNDVSEPGISQYYTTSFWSQHQKDVLRSLPTPLTYVPTYDGQTGAWTGILNLGRAGAGDDALTVNFDFSLVADGETFGPFSPSAASVVSELQVLPGAGNDIITVNGFEVVPIDIEGGTGEDTLVVNNYVCDNDRFEVQREDAGASVDIQLITGLDTTYIHFDVGGYEDKQATIDLNGVSGANTFIVYAQTAEPSAIIKIDGGSDLAATRLIVYGGGSGRGGDNFFVSTPGNYDWLDVNVAT